MKIQRFNFHSLQDFSSQEDAQVELVETEVPKEESIEQAPPPPPTFSETQLEQAKREAFEQGKQEGKESAETTAQQEATQASQELQRQLQQLGQYIQQADQRVQAHIEQQHQQLTALAHYIGVKIAEASLMKNASPVIASILKQCLPHLVHQPALLIKTTQGSTKAVEEIMEKLSQEHHYKGAVSIREDSNMAPGDIRVDWQFGSAERSLDTLMKELNTIFPTLENYISGDENFSQKQSTTEEDISIDSSIIPNEPINLQHPSQGV